LKCKPERFQKRKNKKKREKRSRGDYVLPKNPVVLPVNTLKLMTAMIVPANIAAISTQADF
jgi:hypothetical protein